MKEYKCMGCLTSFEAEYKEDCPSCGDDSDVIEVSAHTDKLSVEKLQEQLNTIKAALIVIRADIEEHNQIYDLSVDTALLLEVIDGIAFEALEAEEEEND